jgi:hypothetical protein
VPISEYRAFSFRCASRSGCSARRLSRTRSCAKRCLGTAKNGHCEPLPFGTTRREVNIRWPWCGALQSGCPVSRDDNAARRGCRPQPTARCRPRLRRLFRGQPIYGYQRIDALIRRRAEERRPAGAALRALIYLGLRMLHRAHLNCVEKFELYIGKIYIKARIRIVSH